MKKIIIMALLCLQFSSVIHAQDNEEAIAYNGRTYIEIFDSLSSGLIQSRIPYGILYNRVMDWSHLDTWTNMDTNDTYRLFQAWWDIEHADYNKTEHSYDAMRTKANEKIRNGIFPILIVKSSFGVLDPTAFEDGRARKENGILYDNNLANTPYIEKTICMSTPVMGSVRIGDEVSFLWDDDYILNTTDQEIESVKLVNKNTHEIIPLIKGSISSITISEELTRLEVIGKIDGLEISLGFSTIQALNKRDYGWNADCHPENRLVSSTIPYKGPDEPIATTTHSDYHIYYHYQNPNSTDCERILKKPIIVLDGFDPLDGHPMGKIDNVDPKKSTYRDFITFYDENFIDYTIPGSSLGEEYRKMGYDIVVLNFPTLGSVVKGYDSPNDDVHIPTHVYDVNNNAVNRNGRIGGADYVQRNAYVLVKLIQELNAELQANGSNEGLVIIGPSMGGQISRYALAYMEKQQALNVPNMDHNTRLWISFDSPHKGANITLGAQQALYSFGYDDGEQSAVDQYNLMLKSKAALSFLIEQDNGNSFSHLNGNSPYFTHYYNDLQSNGLPNSNGFPQNVRKISWSNGSSEGKLNGFAGKHVVGISGTKTTAVFGDIKGFQLDIRFNGNANQNVETLYKFRKTGAIGSVSKSKSISNGYYRGSMDTKPGGTFPAPNVILTQVAKTLDDKISSGDLTFKDIYANHPTNCFIPLTSALAFNNTNINWEQLVSDRDLVCTGEIPFDNYYHPKVNEEHSYIQTESAAWLKDEILYGKQGCPTICSHKINGSNTVCYNQTQTYSLDVNIPANAQTLWNVGGGLIILSSNNNSVTVKSINANAISTTWIRAQITPLISTQKCGANKVIEQNVLTGNYHLPLPTITVTPITTGKYEVKFQFAAPPIGITSNWQVTKWSNNQTIVGTNGGTATFIAIVGNTTPANFTISATNNDGCSIDPDDWSVVVHANGNVNTNVLYKTTPLHSDTTFKDVIYPNPSSTNWIYSIMNEKTDFLKFELYDITGKLIYNKTHYDLNLNNLNIPCQHLPTGMYNLKVFNGQEVMNYKLMKK